MPVEQRARFSSTRMLDLALGEQPNDRRLFTVILAVTIAATPVMALVQTQLGFALTLGLLMVAVLIALMTAWPILGVYALAICAVVVEQEALPYPIITDHLYIFYWPTQLEGLPERPIGFLALLILLVIVVRRLAGRKGAPLRTGPLIWPFLALLAWVAVGVAHGLTTGGDARIIVLEVRPFWYLFINYLLAYNLVTEKRHVIGLLWITVLGTFIKAIQGVYIVFGPLGGHISGHNEIMAHEQSFFFVLVLLLILLCLLLGRMRWLLWISIVSTPFLFIALVANNRRADYVAFLIGAIAVWIFAIAVRPEARKVLVAVMIVCALLFGGYVAAFYHSSGSMGDIARSVVSVVHPSASDIRDAASNAYRYIENYDLKYTEAQSPILGWGFGKEFLQPLVLPNIITLDPYYLYIPHNTILWVWMRLGPIGYAALWYLLGGFIIRAGIIARKLRDLDLRFVAIFGIGVMLIEIPLAYGDYQLFFYRNIFFLGLLMGAIMRLPALDTATVAPEEAATVNDSHGSNGSPAKTRRPIKPWPSGAPAGPVGGPVVAGRRGAVDAGPAASDRRLEAPAGHALAAVAEDSPPAMASGATRQQGRLADEQARDGPAPAPDARPAVSPLPGAQHGHATRRTPTFQYLPLVGRGVLVGVLAFVGVIGVRATPAPSSGLNVTPPSRARGGGLRGRAALAVTWAALWVAVLLIMEHATGIRHATSQTMTGKPHHR